ncbi:interferon-induced protein 44-like [Synchiropus picturatus]
MDKATGSLPCRFSFGTSVSASTPSESKPETQKQFSFPVFQVESKVRPSREVRQKEKQGQIPQWREVEWTEEQREDLMTTVCSYSPSYEFVTQARVLLLGPVASGKSSFISSVQSVLNGRVTNRAMVGTSPSSFTKKLQSFNLLGPPGDEPTGLVLCDMMGLESEISRLSLHDILSVIKGHVPEGHKFTQHTAITSETPGYIKKPSLQEKIHCVAFVVDASQLMTYHKSLSAAFAELREHISDLGVHQVALLTNVDKVCIETAKDTSLVYRSSIIRDTMHRAGTLLGMSTSYIVPVKNYFSELSTSLNTDILLLKAVDHILQYVELYLKDNCVKKQEAKAVGEKNFF